MPQLAANAEACPDDRPACEPDVSIAKAARLIDAITSLYPIVGDFDEVRNYLVAAEGEARYWLLNEPAKSVNDLRLKMQAWHVYIDDPMCVMEWHLDAWDCLCADVARLADVPALQERAVAA